MSGRSDETKPRTARARTIAALNQAVAMGDQAGICRYLNAEVQRQGPAQVAKRAGMTRSTVHAALGPNGNPTMDTSLRISMAIGIIWRAEDAHLVDSAREKPQNEGQSDE